MRFSSVLRAACCCAFLFTASTAAVSQSSMPPGWTPTTVITPKQPTTGAARTLAPTSSAGPTITYPDTSLTACPADQTLVYFYYASTGHGEEYHGDSWCGGAQADLDWANATDPNRWRIPYLLDSCTPGVSWSYSHAFQDGSRYHSPLYRGINLVCSIAPPPPPPPPLGCGAGEGGFSACPPDTGVPPSDPPPAPPGSPGGSGPGPNGGAPGGPWSPDPIGDGPPVEPPPVNPNGPLTNDSGTGCANVAAIGDPIFAATGNNFQEEVDYRGPHGLNLIRRYNSSLPGWVHNYSVRVLAGAALARVIRPDGRAHLFAGSGPGEWTGEAAARERLFKLTPSDASQPLWKYLTASNATEWYDAQGRILSITRNGGMSYTFEQRDGLLRSVRDSFGAALQFAYDGQNRLMSVTTPEGTRVNYSYDAQGRLVQVGYADGSTRSYLYENSAYPLALTGLVDERGVRLATWSYDAAGRAVSSEHTGGVERFQLAFNSDGSVVVTDPLGMARTQTYSTAGARKVFAGQSQPCAGCLGDAATTVVDAATGLLTQSTDYLGFATLFTNDPRRKLPIAVTRAAGRPEQQLRRIEWATNFRLPALVTESGRTTAYTYDAAGNKLNQTVTDLVTGQARSWQWTYTTQGLVATMTDPKGAVWTYGYDGAGNRVSVRNPLGQQAAYTYDAAGRVTGQTEPNGLVTTFTYDSRGRLTQQVRGGESTTYAYTPTGKLASAAMPNGYQVTYSYDAAQRVVGATDNRGATIQYTLGKSVV